MRIRSIKPDFFKDEELAALDPLARLLFIGLWQMADGEGRLEDRPLRIKAEVLPYDSCDVDAFLDDLHAGEFITRYTVDADELILVRQFRKHQRLSGVEAAAESEHPSPEHPEAVEKQSRSNGEAFEKRRLLLDVKSRSSREAANVQEGKGMGGKGRERKVSVHPADASRALFLECFWPHYPKKKNKGQAEKTWARMAGDEREAAIKAVRVFGGTWAGAAEDRKRFIPMASSWLNNRGWEDDPAEWTRDAASRGAGRDGRPAPPLLGAHPHGPKLREVDEDSPEEIRAISTRLRRREATDDEVATLDAWQRGTDAH